MVKNNPPKPELRRKAEAKLTQVKQAKPSVPMTDLETQRLLHELQVHQIELELQNEELLASQAEVETGLRQYTELYDFAPVGYFSLERDGKIRRVNLTGASLLGVERSRLIQRRLGAFVSEGLRVVFNDYLERVFTSQKKETCEISLDNGTNAPRWMHMEGIIEDGEICRAVLIDITARKQAEEVILSNISRLNLSMKAANMAWWEMDINTGHVVFDKQKTDMLGYSSEKFHHYKDFMALVHPDDFDKAMNAMQMHLTGAVEKYEVEYRILTKSGDYEWFYDIGAIEKRDSQGTPLTVAGLVLDITERKLAEEKIKEYSCHLEEMVEERTRELRETQQKLVNKEKLAVLGQLAGGLGHELRNPLGVISNAIYYLKITQPDTNDKVRDYHIMIEQEVHNAQKIVDDLLDFARGISVEREPVLVSDLVQNVLLRFPAPPSLEVAVNLPADLPRVFADPRQVEQVLGNLVVNAYQAMPQGGQLSITCEKSSVKNDPYVWIALKDTGTGITPENMQKLFEPLFTTKYKGIGLGLPISRKYVEANGGRIEVESEIGKGSTFTVFLPIHQKAETNDLV